MSIKARKSYFLTVFFIFSILTIACAPTVAAKSKIPAPDKIRYPELQYKLPQAERIVLENGIIIYFLEDNELPLISINAIFKAGTMNDPEGKEGVAELTAYLMRTGGSLQLSSAEIDRKFDFIAASPSINASLDSVTIRYSFLNKDVDLGLDLLSQIITMPAFEQSKLNLARELKKEELRRIKDNPQKLAFREFNRLIYSNDPRGRLASFKSVNNIQRDDLVKFHEHFIRPQNMMMAVTGNITKPDVINKISRYFGNWKTGHQSVFLPPPKQERVHETFFIRKDISQSTIIRGQFAPGKNDPDYYAFAVLDFIVGSGGFLSRIFTAVRNNEGLAYSAHSFYRARPDYGIFAAYAFTKTEATFQTFSLLNSTIEDARHNTIADKEIEWARKSINNGFVFSFTSVAQIAWQQMRVEYERLPADFLETYCRKIEQVKIDDLNRVARKYMDKKNSLVLILGNIEKLGDMPTTVGKPVLITPED